MPGGVIPKEAVCKLACLYVTCDSHVRGLARHSWTGGDLDGA